MEKEHAKWTEKDVRRWITEGLHLKIDEEAWESYGIDGATLESLDETLFEALRVEERDQAIISKKIGELAQMQVQERIQEDS